jgi:hypothetical protein
MANGTIQHKKGLGGVFMRQWSPKERDPRGGPVFLAFIGLGRTPADVIALRAVF